MFLRQQQADELYGPATKEEAAAEGVSAEVWLKPLPERHTSYEPSQSYKSFPF